MKVIIMGCGRVGEEVSRLMEGGGIDVTVIDADAVNLEHRAQFSGQTIRGVGFDREVLLSRDRERRRLCGHQPIGQRQHRGGPHCPQYFSCAACDCPPVRPAPGRDLPPPGPGDHLDDVVGRPTHQRAAGPYQPRTDVLFGRGEVSLVAIEIPSHLVGRTVSHVTVPGEINVVAITRQGEALMTTWH